MRSGGVRGRGGGDVEEEMVFVAASEDRGVSANGLLSLRVLPGFLQGDIEVYICMCRCTCMYVCMHICAYIYIQNGLLSLRVLPGFLQSRCVCVCV